MQTSNKEVRVRILALLAVGALVVANIISTQRQPPVRSGEISAFSRQFGGYIAKGNQSFATCIRAAADRQRNLYFQQVLFDVQKRVSMGESLSGAMARHKDVFNGQYLRAVRHGERTGTLDIAMQDLGRER